MPGRRVWKMYCIALRLWMAKLTTSARSRFLEGFFFLLLRKNLLDLRDFTVA